MYIQVHDNKQNKILTRSVIIPPKDSPENGPPLAIKFAFGVAAVQVPHITLDAVRARTVPTSIVDVRAEQLVERMFLERGDGLAEETRADEEEEVSHDDEEDG